MKHKNKNRNQLLELIQDNNLHFIEVVLISMKINLNKYNKIFNCNTNSMVKVGLS
jgi:hypothetical protein